MVLLTLELYSSRYQNDRSLNNFYTFLKSTGTVTIQKMASFINKVGPNMCFMIFIGKFVLLSQPEHGLIRISCFMYMYFGPETFIYLNKLHSTLNIGTFVCSQGQTDKAGSELQETGKIANMVWK